MTLATGIRYLREVLVPTLLICVLGLFAFPLAAHHVVSQVCDTTKVVTLKGAVTKIDWTNPHTFVWLDVKNHDGSITHWTVTLSGPGSMKHQGVTKESFEIGREITVDAWLYKDGSPRADAAYGGTVVLANGKTFKEPFWVASGKEALSRTVR